MSRLQTGIILAAGASSRMGSPKALVRDGRGRSFLERLASTLRAGGCDAVLAVVGCHVREIAATLPEGVLLVFNPDWERGQLSSAQAGLRAALALSPAKLLVHPVDQPLIQPADVAAVLAAAGARRLSVACHRGERGHPIALAAPLASAVAGDLRHETLREALAAHASGMRLVSCSSGAVRGANTPRELNRLLASRRVQRQG